MRAGNAYIPSLLPKLCANPRFSEVNLAVYTGAGGSIGFWGSVTNETALSDLHKIADMSSSPVPIIFFVEVDSPNTQPSATEP